MAKFNAEEVSALQARGNERARQIYFKEWDPQYHSYPDAGNFHGLRSFIKHVYVDRKYTGERSVYTGERSIYTSERSGNKLPMLRLSTEESDENQKVGGHRSGSNSFHDDDRLERSYSNSPGGRSLRYYYDERRSPRYSPENSRSGGFIRAPLRFEIVDNRIRGEKRGSSSGESKVQSRTPDNKKTSERSHSPVVPPVKDKLRENMPPPQVGESSTANQKDTDGSAHNQKTKSTGGHDGNATEQNIVSLIDFNTDSEPPHATESQLQQTPPPNEDNNWASFGSSTTEKAPQVPTVVPNADPLESLLFELSTPSSVPASNASVTPHNDGAPSTASINTMPAGGNSPADAGPVQDLAIFGGDTTVKGTDEKQLVLSTQQDQSSISFTADSGSTSHVNFAVGASNSELRNLSLAPSIQRSFSIPSEKSSQSILNPAEHTDSGSGARSQVEMNSSMRKELPAGVGGFGRDEAAFGSLTTTQQSFQEPRVRYPAPSRSSTLDTFSPMRGNPFG